uniref:Uncharacterized protein n=1 Tax=Avena sativa TaxID=4498 RepID=A0ACD5TE98_AVESA
MAPEAARGEEQGPAADVWALGCTVLELATGRAPWGGAESNALAAMHRIGYTDAVPEVPQWLSPEAKDLLGMCFVRRASDRCTAAQLLEHPFLASAVEDMKSQTVERKWVSPKSTLDAAFWESEESDSEVAYDDELSHSSTAERINSLACPTSALPDWDSDEGWIDVLSAAGAEAQEAVAMPAEETTGLDETITSGEPSGTEPGVLDIAAKYSSDSSVLSAGDADVDSVGHNRRRHQCLENSVYRELPCSSTRLFGNRINGNSVRPNALFPAASFCFSLYFLLCDTFD